MGALVGAAVVGLVVGLAVVGLVVLGLTLGGNVDTDGAAVVGLGLVGAEEFVGRSVSGVSVSESNIPSPVGSSSGQQRLRKRNPPQTPERQSSSR